MIDLDQVIAGTHDVPALSQSAARLCALLSNDDWDLDQIAETVQLDPVLMGRILKTANSVAGASLTAITDLSQAAMRVGPGAILALAMSSAAKECLDVVLPSYGLNEGRLWRNSVTAALTVECARKHCKQNPPPEAFAAALLHDIGILVLSHQLDTDVLELLKRAQEEGGHTLTESEMEILSVDHGEVGGLIARHWKLPEVVVEAITFHHDPTSAYSAEGRHLADFVALGDAVSGSLGGNDVAREKQIVQNAELFERLGLDRADFCDLADDVEEELEAVLTRYE